MQAGRRAWGVGELASACARAYVMALLAHRSTNELSHARHEHVHRGTGQARCAVGPRVVAPHVKGLDCAGVVVDNHGLLEDDFAEVALVLAGHVDAPFHLLLLGVRLVEHVPLRAHHTTPHRTHRQTVSS